MIRQGDILLRKVRGVPKGAQRLATNVIAEGETTGHKHQLLAEECVLFEAGGVMFASLSEATVLSHEEHENIVVPPGHYEVVRQREFTFEEVVRQVAD